MKLTVVLLGALLCLGAEAPAQTKSQDAKQATKSTQSANRMKRTTANSSGSFVGCVDEQDGKYVLLDEQMRRYITLQPAGTDADSAFARFVGHKVQVSGAQPAGEANTVKVEHIGAVASMCGAGK